MTRPLRLEFPGAIYHVTSRGDRSNAIFRDNSDRYAWLETMALACKRCNFIVHAFCQMTNHYHILLETVEGNLGLGMRDLNGLYTQRFNRRHKLIGHVFQGRYKAILVQRESHLLELTRYVVLNPLRAGIVPSLMDWPWSSYRAMVGQVDPPQWLQTEWLLSQFSADRNEAVQRYQQFVLQGIGLSSPLTATRHQILLGDDEFVARHQDLSGLRLLRDVSRAQRRVLALSLNEYESRYKNRLEAMRQAYFSTAYTMSQIARHFGVSAKTVSRAVRRFDGE